MKKLFLSLIIMFVCIFGIKYNVYAEEQEENYRIDVIAETGNAGSALKMSLEGFDKANAIEKGYSYYVKFVKNENEKPVLSETLDELTEESDETFGAYYHVNLAHNKEKDIYNSSIYIEYDWYMVDGYTKAYIVKCALNSETYKKECEVLEKPVTVEKPALPSLSQRYKYYLFGDEYELHVFPYFPYLSGKNGSHELNVKIGLINDNQLLKKISRNEAGSYESLITYAKTNDGQIYTFPDGESYKIDTSGFEVVNGSYYYIYAYYTNTDGLYRNLDDVTVVMGDHDMLVNDVVWNFDESVWDQFVEKYKETEIIDEFIKEDVDLEITHTSDSLKIVASKDDKSYTTNFTYEDGILTYVPSGDDNESLFGNLCILNALHAISGLYGYDIDKITEWFELNKDNDFTLAKDGIEFQFTEIEYEDETLEVIESFRLDIYNGIKKFNEELEEEVKVEIKEETKKEEKVENPNTGIDLGIGVLILIIIGSVGYFLMRKQSKFPKHN